MSIFNLAEHRKMISSAATPVRSLLPQQRTAFAPPAEDFKPASLRSEASAKHDPGSPEILSAPESTTARERLPASDMRTYPFGGTRPLKVQPKIAGGSPDDEYEREADRVAEQALRMPESAGTAPLPFPNGEEDGTLKVKPTNHQSAPVIQRQFEPEEEEKEEEEADEEGIFQAKSKGDPTPPIDGVRQEQIQDLRSGGRALDPAARAFAELRLSHNFGRVRVHTDARAADSAKSLNALAYTVGENIIFGAGQYAPSTPAGNKLLLHELTHVIQQNGAALIGGQGRSTGESQRPSERDSLCKTAPSGINISRISRPMLQRETEEQRRKRICYHPGTAPANRKPTDCDAREPENCPTYELWLNTFTRLRTSSTRDTSPDVEQAFPSQTLGERAIRPVDLPPFPFEARPRPPPMAIRPVVADRFIDHPTDIWVKTCLPHNLRETAYRLPSDCADIAVILRHVWLSAHHRTERFSRWTIGDRAGRARRAHIDWVIGGVLSSNVHRMLNAYSDSKDRPIRSFNKIQKLLHPGDVLVWEHHRDGLGTRRSGGHTQTIIKIARSGDRITRIDVVAGDQPINEAESKEIRSYLKEENLRKQREEQRLAAIKPFLKPQFRSHRRSRPTPVPSEEKLRTAAGRRIDVDSISGSNLQDHPRLGIWMLNDGEYTTLVAAGPPASARRPAMRRIERQTIRRISDWNARLHHANSDALHPNLEAALLELRSLIEGGQTGLDQDAVLLGRIAGDRLWFLARRSGQSRSGDLAEETHFRPLLRISAMIRALGDPAADVRRFTSQPSDKAAEVKRIFGLVDVEFQSAARGATTIAFHRRIRPGKTLIRTLVTGFDPFTEPGQSVPAGVVNPSGATALAMDNTEVAEGQAVAAVEGIVLPVDFEYLRGGNVEDILRPLVKNRNLDAILTVGMDESLAPADPVRVEKYVVGVRKGDKGLEPITAPGGGGIGPAIFVTPAPLEEIAMETERPAAGRRTPAIPRPTIGTSVTFRFSDTAVANQAMSALGLPPVSGHEVPIGDVIALRQIIRTMHRSPNGTDITFQAGGGTFQATVVEGPGGNYPCNELSYRVLRLLEQEKRLDKRLDIPSFLVHTQRPLEEKNDRIPQDVSTPSARRSRRAAIRFAIGVRNRLIDTLRNMIRAIVRLIMARSQPPGGPTP